MVLSVYLQYTNSLKSSSIILTNISIFKYLTQILLFNIQVPNPDTIYLQYSSIQPRYYLSIFKYPTQILLFKFKYPIQILPFNFQVSSPGITLQYSSIQPRYYSSNSSIQPGYYPLIFKYPTQILYL